MDLDDLVVMHVIICKELEHPSSSARTKELVAQGDEILKSIAPGQYGEFYHKFLALMNTKE